jgi:hypothetical protein
VLPGEIVYSDPVGRELRQRAERKFADTSARFQPNPEEEAIMEQAFKGKEKEWAKIIARTWTDEEFKKRLLADPKAVLKEEGIEFSEDLKLTIVDGKKDELHLTLPPRPEGGGSIEDLQERLQADWGLCYG